jgi:hypothetical protein
MTDTTRIDLDAIEALIKRAEREEATVDAFSGPLDETWDALAEDAGEASDAANDALRAAFPAMAAELRALREVARAATVAIGSRDILAGRAALDRIDVLRAALAKVPR